MDFQGELLHTGVLRGSCIKINNSDTIDVVIIFPISLMLLLF